MHWILALPFLGSAGLQLVGAWVGPILSVRTDQHIDDLLNKKLGQYPIVRENGEPGGEILSGTTVNDLHVAGLNAEEIRGRFSIEKDAVVALVSLPALVAPILLTVPSMSQQALYFSLVMMAAIAVGIVVVVTNADPIKYRAGYRVRISPVGLGIVAINVIMAIVLTLGIVK
ncbi:hypothetical protein [Mycobacteroides abscessus]|uniref:hypothetical protein n=1 Tax=Mycobacteroides abscessus TaxID=36809 RepID=UPI0012FFE708|nr:hypothetical protein [Mycobacteroides abscessus]